MLELFFQDFSNIWMLVGDIYTIPPTFMFRVSRTTIWTKKKTNNIYTNIICMLEESKKAR